MAVFLTASAFATSLDFSTVNLRVFSAFGPDRNGRDVEVSPTAPQVLEVLSEPGLAVRFPFSPSALPGAFASAAMSANRAGGVGISGFVFRRPEAFADATYKQTIFNLNDDAETGLLLMQLDIPNIEAAVFVGRSIIEGPTAAAGASLLINLFDAEGNKLRQQTLFDYAVLVAITQNEAQTSVTPDLQKERGSSEVVFLNTTGELQGLRYEPFSVTQFLPSIPPGGRMDLEYSLNARGSTETPEVGYQAFVGDPFDISAGGGFEIRPADVTVVPEPGYGLLIPGAIVAMLLARRLHLRRGSCR
jgi:hypothetical protein